MADFAEVWKQVMPEVRDGVTGRGVWQALNLSVPVALDEGQFVLGIPLGMGELGGHLKMHATKLLIERLMGQKLGEQVSLRVIDGTDVASWETQKRRDAEAKRLQEQALERARVEATARTSWDKVYEQISRLNGATQNKSLPQNRANFMRESIEIVVEALRDAPINSDLDERNYARCIERIAQYADCPSVLVAQMIYDRITAG